MISKINERMPCLIKAMTQSPIRRFTNNISVGLQSAYQNPLHVFRPRVGYQLPVSFLDSPCDSLTMSKKAVKHFLNTEQASMQRESMVIHHPLGDSKLDAFMQKKESSLLLSKVFTSNQAYLELTQESIEMLTPLFESILPMKKLRSIEFLQSVLIYSNFSVDNPSVQLRPHQDRGAISLIRTLYETGMQSSLQVIPKNGGSVKSIQYPYLASIVQPLCEHAVSFNIEDESAMRIVYNLSMMSMTFDDQTTIHPSLFWIQNGGVEENGPMQNAIRHHYDHVVNYPSF